MTHFDKLVEELGWERVYPDKFLFITKKKDNDDFHTIAFSTCASYDIGDLEDDRLNKKHIDRFLRAVCCHTKCKEESINWVIPLLTADYYAHRYDFANELIWAKKAMKENDKLTPMKFSSKIRERL
jgi:hypothetical protein